MSNKLFRKKQNGAVMLEAAYVLPILVGLTLFVLETLSFALNSFVVNDVFTDVHLVVANEAQEMSAMSATQAAELAASEQAAAAAAEAAGEEAPLSTFQYVVCNGGQVVLADDGGSKIKGLIADALAKNKVTLNSGPFVNVAHSQSNGFHVYVVTFSGEANTLTLPGFFSKALPMKVDTVISLKASCSQ